MCNELIKMVLESHFFLNSMLVQTNFYGVILDSCNYCTTEINYHERFDGKGYPLGKSGNDIPLGSRIIAICDSIDAMTSNRCYMKSLSFEDCYNQIKINLGKMYDPEIRKIVLENWNNIINIIS